MNYLHIWSWWNFWWVAQNKTFLPILEWQQPSASEFLPVFPRYLLLSSIAGKPAPSTELHAANICSPKTALACHREYLFFYPFGSRSSGSDFNTKILASHEDHLPSFLKLLPPPTQGTTQPCCSLQVSKEFFVSGDIQVSCLTVIFFFNGMIA